MTAEERLETDMNVIKTGLTARFKGKVKSASGDYRDIEVAKYPISLNNGKPLVLALWRDITSELATENTLRRTRILTKMALRISDIRTCSIFIDPDSTHNFKDSVVTLNDWNTMSEDMIEVSWGQFISRAHPDDQEHYHNMFTRHFAEGKSLRQGSRHVCYFPARRNMFGERYSLPCMNGTIKEDLRLSLDVQRIFRNGRIKN